MGNKKSQRKHVRTHDRYRPDARPNGEGWKLHKKYAVLGPACKEEENPGARNAFVTSLSSHQQGQGREFEFHQLCEVVNGERRLYAYYRRVQSTKVA